MKDDELNYGALTEVSRGLNSLLGDNSGRTVSRRTTHGFKRSFNLSDQDISDTNAEHIVHGAMISTGTLIASKNEGSRVAGILLLASLFLFYQAGE